MATDKKQVLTVRNIRNVNVENILQSVIRTSNMTRTVLAKENHISVMTVKHVVDDLIAAHILEEKDYRTSDVGRNPKVLALTEEYGNIVCVNLTSEDETSFLIYDIYENLLINKCFRTEEMTDYVEFIEKIICEIQNELKHISSETVGIAIFVPSAYDEAADMVNYDLIPGFQNLHIRSLFKKRFGIRTILVLHDVFAAARSEYDRLDSEMESQFYFYCGHGVGGFFIHKGENIAGAENMAGEIGKMLVSVDRNDQRVLEDLVSISSIKKRMKEKGITGHFAELLEQYQIGNDNAVEVMDDVLNTLSRALYNMLWAYNPTRVVIDSCNREYSKIITEAFTAFMENMKNDAIPIHAKISQARYDEYHMMRGCFHMVRNAWIEELALSLAETIS